MTKRILAVLIFLVIGSGFTDTSSRLGETEEFWVNGLKVILGSNEANDVISVQLYIRGGVLNLSEATQGIEPLMVQSAIRGSENFPRTELNALLDATAASITSGSNRDYTSVSLRTVKDYFDDTWPLFADVVMHPTLNGDDVDFVRENMLIGIRGRTENPDSYLEEIVGDLFYANHPYSLDASGVEESITNITIGQMREHHAQFMRTSNMLLVVVGDVDRDDLRRKVEATLGTLPQGDYEPTYAPAVTHLAPSLVVVERALPTNYIMGAVSAPSRRDEDYYAMRVAISILNARVFEEVRTNRGLSYAPSARFYNSLSNRAALYVTAADPEATIPVMLNEVRRLQMEPVLLRDVEDRKAIYLTTYFLQNETNGSQAAFLASFELAGVGWQAGAEFVDNIVKVTAEDIQRVANEYLKNFQFGILGNPEQIVESTYTAM